ncbi:MAG: glycosyl hydrolase family 28-related protein [Akkermansiaceae bacterium]|nr:glycosyl hydrolase family 28-related protein [Akkermansiaceae bacterium]
MIKLHFLNIFFAAAGALFAANESAQRPGISATESTPLVRRGATVPWVEYQAETGETNGEILAPDRTFGTIAAESTGRSAVKLKQAGQYLQFKTTAAANSVVVRFVIPDSHCGAGLQATLSLYVDHVFRRKINLTSKYAWAYGGEEKTSNDPELGGAHHFYDEARALVGDIPAGATVKLQKDADDRADYDVIDLVDLEQVAPPKTKPAGYLSIEDCGAVSGSEQDSGDAIQACIKQAKAAKQGVWIPVGNFYSERRAFDVSEVTIQGAGMWYSTLRGQFARFNCKGSNCRFADFAILGETICRDDKSPEDGFCGQAGTGSRLENIWVEHTKVGFWVSGGTTGLVVTGGRFRNVFADGINFCNGTSDSVVENSHFRNTGDDALASWSPKKDPVNTGNVFRFNTIQVPWRANGLAIYGGKDNRIENNLCDDVVTYPGILIAHSFESNPFQGTTVVQHNSLIRAGGPMFRAEHGALKIDADQGEIRGLVVSDLLIDGATFTGIELRGRYPITEAVFDHVQIVRTGAQGIYIKSDLAGDAAFSSTNISDSGKEALFYDASKALFKLKLGEGNHGMEVRLPTPR